MSSEQAAASGASDVQDPKPQPAIQPSDRRERLFREAVIAASIPIMLLFAPLVAPVDGDRSIYDEVRRETTALIIVGLPLIWPLVLGSYSLIAGLRGRAPGKVTFGITAVIQILMNLGLSLVAFLLVMDKRRLRDNPMIWLCGVAGILAVYLIVRRFRRAAWERWTHLLGGIWFMILQGALLFWLEAGYLFDEYPPLGTWLLLFALTALLPIFVWALWPRRT